MHYLERRNELIIYGGVNLSGNLSNSILIYSFESETWSEFIPSVDEYSPKTSFGHSSTAVSRNNSIFLYVLSKNKSGSKTYLDFYDVANRKWKRSAQTFTTGAMPYDIVLDKFSLNYISSSDVLTLTGLKNNKLVQFLFSLEVMQWNKIEMQHFNKGNIYQFKSITSYQAFSFQNHLVEVVGFRNGKSSISLFNARCNKRTIAMEITGIDGELSAMNNVLLIQGGYIEGQITSRILAYNLPEILKEPTNKSTNLLDRCLSYKSLEVCLADSPCKWCKMWEDKNIATCGLVSSIDEKSMQSCIPRIFKCDFACEQLQSCQLCNSYYRFEVIYPYLYLVLVLCRTTVYMYSFFLKKIKWSRF